jgi:hypothetical protein
MFLDCSSVEAADFLALVAVAAMQVVETSWQRSEEFSLQRGL